MTKEERKQKAEGILSKYKTEFKEYKIVTEANDRYTNKNKLAYRAFASLGLYCYSILEDTNFKASKLQHVKCVLSGSNIDCRYLEFLHNANCYEKRFYTLLRDIMHDDLYKFIMLRNSDCDKKAEKHGIDYYRDYVSNIIESRNDLVNKLRAIIKDIESCAKVDMREWGTDIINKLCIVNSDDTRKTLANSYRIIGARNSSFYTLNEYLMITALVNDTINRKVKEDNYDMNGINVKHTSIYDLPREFKREFSDYYSDIKHNRLAMVGLSKGKLLKILYETIHVAVISNVMRVTFKKAYIVSEEHSVVGSSLLGVKHLSGLTIVAAKSFLNGGYIF
jgi:hypothetical protein